MAKPSRQPRPTLVLACALGAILVPAPSMAAAEPACPGPCEGDPECALLAAACQIEAGDPRAALAEIKPAVRAHPEDGRLARAAAASYLAEGNVPWAVRALLAHVELRPDDVESRSWAAWVLMRDGDLARAATLLDAVPSAEGPPGVRIDLLRAALADLRGDPEAAEAALRRATASGRSPLQEDVALRTDLRRRLLGDPARPLSLRVQLGAGFTSSAVGTSPEDAGTTEGGGQAPVLFADAVLRLEPWTSRWIRPQGEARLRAFGPLSPGTIDSAWADLSARAGVEIGGSGPRFLVAWSGELLALHGGDAYRDPGPRWFAEAHRAEIEFSPVPQVQVFLGAGRRIYRERPRTRTEIDGGIAVLPPLPRRWTLAVVALGRWNGARSDAWDGGGATALLRVGAPLPGGGVLEGKILGSLDAWPDSAPWYDSDVARRDLLVRGHAGAWSPPLPGGVRLGGSYQVAWRSSTVQEHRYLDHRLLAELRWERSWDPFSPRPVDVEPGHWDLPWGLEGEDASGLDRVRDLLQQEDGARRGSSCVD